MRPCPLFASLGQCPYGFKCQFSASHLRSVGEGNGFMGTGWELVVDHDKVAKLEAEKGEGKGQVGEKGEINVIDMTKIREVRGQGLKAEVRLTSLHWTLARFLIRYHEQERYPLSKIYMDSIGEALDNRENGSGAGGGGSGKGGKKGNRNAEVAAAKTAPASAPAPEPTPEDAKAASAAMDVDPSPTAAVDGPDASSASTSTLPTPTVPTPTDAATVTAPAPDDTISDTSGMPDLAPIRASEKKRLDFRGKLCLSSPSLFIICTR